LAILFRLISIPVRNQARKLFIYSYRFLLPGKIVQSCGTKHSAFTFL
jgi:hypothetical protein